MQETKHVNRVGVVTVDGDPTTTIGCTQMKSRVDSKHLVEENEALWTFGQ